MTEQILECPYSLEELDELILKATTPEDKAAYKSLRNRLSNFQQFVSEPDVNAAL